MPVPSDIANLALRLLASSASGFADGADVTTITSTVGATTFNSTGTAPKRRAGVFNGKDVLEFLTGAASNNGVTKGGLLATDTTKMQTVLSGTFTAAFVVKLGDGGFGAFMGKGGIGDRTCFLHFGQSLSVLNGKLGVWSNLKTTATGFNDGLYHLVVYVIDTAANTGKIYVDNVEVASGAVPTVDADAASALALGSISVTGGEFSAKMNLAEYLLYGSGLNTTDLNTLALYAASEYSQSFGGISPGLNAPVLSSANIASCRVNMSWTAATGGSGTGFVYRIYRRTTNGTAAQIAANGTLLYTGSNLFHPDMFLPSSTTYYYAVSVTDSASTVAYSNVVTVTTLTANALKLGILGDSNSDPAFYADNPATQFKTLWDAAHPALPCTLTNLALAGQKVRVLSRLTYGGNVDGSSLITTNIATFLAAGVTHVIMQEFTNDFGQAKVDSFASSYTKDNAILDLLDIKNALAAKGIVLIINHTYWRLPGTESVAQWNTLISAQSFSTQFRLGDTTSHDYIAADPGTRLLDALHLAVASRPVVGQNWYNAAAADIYNDIAPIDVTAPALSSATINSAGTQITLAFTESGSPPLLPSTGITGFSISGGHSLSSVVRATATTITATISPVVYSSETLTLAYTPGNVTDSATTPNPLAAITSTAITNNSTQTLPQVATPTFSPVAGTFATAQTVSIACTETGAEICYTLDNTTPTGSSALYSTALNILATTPIKAIAIKPGMTNSAVATGVFTITPSITSVSVSPDDATLNGGETQQFSATVVSVGGASQTVTWSKQSGVGTVDASGLYTAPAQITGQAQSAVLRATSNFDNTKFDDVTITIPALSAGGGSVSDEDIARIAAAVVEAMSGNEIRIPVSGPLRLTDADGSTVGNGNNDRISLVQGDSGTSLDFKVYDASNRPIPLSGATATFSMSQIAGNKVVTGEASLVLDLEHGQVFRYTLAAGGSDTNTPGIYNVRVVVTWANGTVKGFPDFGNIIAEVRP